MTPRAVVAFACVLTLLLVQTPSVQGQAEQLLTIDHYVPVKSIVPSMAGQVAQIYVRERVVAGPALRAPARDDRVVLFVHGAGTPAEVAFDPAIGDYSWMAYLARAGFDVFSMDTTGYGRSTRPAPMNDACNLAEAQQAQFVPALLAAPCKPTYPGQVTTIGSDWHDIDGVVDHIRRIRHVSKVSLVAWSLGGPRAGGYAAQHPDKVHRLVLFAPAYNPKSPAAPPALPNAGTVFNTQSRREFDANWDRQLGCADQYDPAVRDAVWAEMLASDPVGASWGPGVRRAPSTTTWGWNHAAISGMRLPTMMIAGVHDKQVTPDRVKVAFDDLGSPEKVLVDLACASHNAMWERNHLLMFRASLDWLTSGAVGEQKTGVVRLGYTEGTRH